MAYTKTLIEAATATAATKIPFTLTAENYKYSSTPALRSTGLKVSDTQITFSVDDTDNSLNDSGTGFVAAGFQVGMLVTVTGFTINPTENNFVNGEITSLTTGKMVIADPQGSILITEAAGQSITITTDGMVAGDDIFLWTKVNDNWAPLGSILDETTSTSSLPTMGEYAVTITMTGNGPVDCELHCYAAS